METDTLLLSQLLKNAVEGLKAAMPFSYWIVAEISELKVNSNGHCYLELIEKDTAGSSIRAKARATIWSSTFRMLQPYFETTTHSSLVAGLKVMVKVTVELHELYGFSLNIIDIEPSYTVGELAKHKQEIIDRLAAEGVIDMNKQLQLPVIPKKIAVISSKTAAGYGDFCDQLFNNSRGYKFHIKLFQAIMQGNEAEQSIIEALDNINRFDDFFDAVVIIRGGGAQSDLNCFNSYWLAYHICQFPLPVITGIGHEQDDTIVDLVAGIRLKTPTAVAEFLISRYDLAYEEISLISRDFADAVTSLIDNEKSRLSDLLSGFQSGVDERLTGNKISLGITKLKLAGATRQNLTRHTYLISKSMENLKSKSVNFLLRLANENRLKSAVLKMNCRLFIEQKTHHAKILDKKNQYLDPFVILKRGYSVTYHNGKAVKNAKDVSGNEYIETRLNQGKLKSKII